MMNGKSQLACHVNLKETGKGQSCNRSRKLLNCTEGMDDKGARIEV